VPPVGRPTDEESQNTKLGQDRMIYQEKTRTLRKGLFEVQNEVGLGRQEEGYHQAYRIWLADNGIPFASKPPHPLMLGGQVAHTLYPDFTAWDDITVELKARPRKLEDSDFVQLFDYLKCRADRLGLLVNMGLERVHVERVVYDPPECELEENWDYWAGGIQGRDRGLGTEVRDALRHIYGTHTTGYSTEVTGKLIHFELSRRGIPFVVSPVARSFYHEQVVEERPLDCLVIDGRLLLVFTALFDSNDFNIAYGKSFMEALGLEWGIAVNFGKRKAQFDGLRHRG